jgi:hypothetical protein
MICQQKETKAAKNSFYYCRLKESLFSWLPSVGKRDRYAQRRTRPAVEPAYGVTDGADVTDEFCQTKGRWGVQSSARRDWNQTSESLR